MRSALDGDRIAVGHESEVGTERSPKTGQGVLGRVPGPPLDPADLALMDPRGLGELSLADPLGLAEHHQFASEPETMMEAFQLRDGVRALGLGLGLDLAHEVFERCPGHGS